MAGADDTVGTAGQYVSRLAWHCYREKLSLGRTEMDHDRISCLLALFYPF